MEAPAPEVRKGRKYDQVLEGARQVFMKDGFEGASVDDIAKAANVSKATLYSYFPDKRLLFTEVATTECDRQACSATAEFDPAAPPAVALQLIGHKFLTFILSVFGQEVFRICVAEAFRFPELGQAFYKSGPEMMRTLLIEYFEQAQARGELNIDDIKMAADQFCELCKADLWPQMVFGIRTEFAPAETARVVDAAVETFLARYSA